MHQCSKKKRTMAVIAFVLFYSVGIAYAGNQEMISANPMPPNSTAIKVKTPGLWGAIKNSSKLGVKAAPVTHLDAQIPKIVSVNFVGTNGSQTTGIDVDIYPLIHVTFDQPVNGGAVDAYFSGISLRAGECPVVDNDWLAQHDPQNSNSYAPLSPDHFSGGTQGGGTAGGATGFPFPGRHLLRVEPKTDSKDFYFRTWDGTDASSLYLLNPNSDYCLMVQNVASPTGGKLYFRGTPFKTQNSPVVTQLKVPDDVMHPENHSLSLVFNQPMSETLFDSNSGAGVYFLELNDETPECPKPVQAFPDLNSDNNLIPKANNYFVKLAKLSTSKKQAFFDIYEALQLNHLKSNTKYCAFVVNANGANGQKMRFFSRTFTTPIYVEPQATNENPWTETADLVWASTPVTTQAPSKLSYEHAGVKGDEICEDVDGSEMVNGAGELQPQKKSVMNGIKIARDLQSWQEVQFPGVNTGYSEYRLKSAYFGCSSIVKRYAPNLGWYLADQSALMPGYGSVGVIDPGALLKCGAEELPVGLGVSERTVVAGFAENNDILGLTDLTLICERFHAESDGSIVTEPNTKRYVSSLRIEPMTEASIVSQSAEVIAPPNHALVGVTLYSSKIVNSVESIQSVRLKAKKKQP